MEKDLGVFVDDNLAFEKHIETQVNKANRVLGLIMRSFIHLDTESLPLLYKSLVRPSRCDLILNIAMSYGFLNLRNMLN